mmetsp:Transcript_33987/g.82437  ORF Transcript_33987/g.82437 Transcript_33987/m.82437 type:complete len:125 (-) Transcript_33987:1521-1895(-)
MDLEGRALSSPRDGAIQEEKLFAGQPEAHPEDDGDDSFLSSHDCQNVSASTPFRLGRKRQQAPSPLSSEITPNPNKKRKRMRPYTVRVYNLPLTMEPRSFSSYLWKGLWKKCTERSAKLPGAYA